MTAALPYLLIVLVFILFRKQGKMDRELAVLKNELSELRKNWAKHFVSSQFAAAPEEPSAPTFQEKIESEPAISRREALTLHARSEENNQAPVKATEKIQSNPPHNPFDEKWDALILRLQNNWAGVLGAFILIMGVAFFAFIASESMGPAGRFGAIMIGSLALTGFAKFLQSKDNWKDFSSWFFGISGSGILIACLGAGGLTPLRFIDNPSLALGVLMLGILSNLLLAFYVRNQYSTAFHSLIGLCALAFVPVREIALLAGATTVLASMGLSYRRLWDKNMVAVILGFLAFHHYILHESLGTTAAIPRTLGIFVSLLVGLCATAVHYDKVYKDRPAFIWPLLAHLINWCGMASLLIRYSQGQVWTGLVLILAGLSLMFIARTARAKNITWLFLADSLIGLLLVLVGIFLLDRLQWKFDILLALCTFALGFFAYLCMHEREEILAKVSLFAQIGFFIALGEWSLNGQVTRHEFSPFILMAITALNAFQYVSTHRRDWAKRLLIRDLSWDLPFLIMTYASLLLAQDGLMGQSWGPAAIAAAWTCLAYFVGAFAKERKYLAMGVLVLTHLFLAQKGYRGLAVELNALLKIGPFVALDLILLLNGKVRSQSPSIARSAAYLGTAAFAFLLHSATYSYSNFVPGILYLISSLGLFELSLHCSRKNQNPPLFAWILHGGAALIVLFFLHHMLVNIAAEATLGFYSIRGIIGIFGLLTLAYWLIFANGLYLNKAFPKWMSVLWEGMLALVLLQISLELTQTTRPLALACLGLALNVTVLRWKWPNRMGVYAWLLLIVSGIELSYILGNWPDLSKEWWTSVSILGCLTLIVQIIHVALVYRSKFWSSDQRRVPEVPWIPSAFLDLFAKFHNWMNFYPVIFFAALFFYWHFDRAVLTLLWFIEIFAVFVLAITIRDRHFVKISYAFLAVCAARLLFYDLAESDLSVRAGVFVFCGALMLGINALHRKFKDRLESGKAE